MTTTKRPTRLQEMFDRWFVSSALAAFIFAVVALYQTFHYLNWPQVEAEVRATGYTCMAIKKEFWSKSNPHEYYRCSDEAARTELFRRGFSSDGATTLNISIVFKTPEGQTISTVISDYSKDISASDRLRKVQVKYSRYSPEDAQFADVIGFMMRDFWVLAVIFSAFSFYFRKLRDLPQPSSIS